MQKTLIPTNDCYIQFTDDELKELNIKPGDKFSVHHHEDDSIELKKYVPLDIDIDDWPVEILLMLIKKSIDQDISVNEVISNSLKMYIKKETLSDERILLHENVKCGKIEQTMTNSDTSITNNK